MLGKEKIKAKVINIANYKIKKTNSLIDYDG
jgi:hypothetical protein